MKSNGSLLQRNVAGVTLFSGMLMCLPASSLLGQAPPSAPLAGQTPASPPAVQTPAKPPAVQTPGTTPTGQTPAAPAVQTPGTPPAGQAPAAPSTAPFQLSPITLPASAPLPVNLNLGAWYGYPTAYISINGKPQRVGISTGLNANTISPVGMTFLAVAEGKSKVRVDVLDREAEAPDTTLKSLQVGLLKLEDVPVAEVDVVSLLTHNSRPGAPIGWLGTPFLSAFQFTLDLAHKVCILDKPTAKMPSGAIVVPMTMRDGHIFVSMTMPKSKPFPAMIDTDTVLTLVPATAAEKLKLTAVEVVKLGGAGGKLVPATLVQLPQLSVGKAECKDIRVAYLSDDVSPGFGRDTAVLGLDFLSHFKVVFNFNAKKVAFIPPVVVDPNAPPPTPKSNTPPSGRGGRSGPLGQTGQSGSTGGP